MASLSSQNKRFSYGRVDSDNISNITRSTHQDGPKDSSLAGAYELRAASWTNPYHTPASLSRTVLLEDQLYSDPKVTERYSRNERSQKFRAVVHRWWMLELISCCIAVVAFVSILVILKIYNKRPLISWPFPITINTLVSLLATLLRSCLIFPLGEALSQLKWRWYRLAQSLDDFQRFDSASRGGFLGTFALFPTIWRPKTHRPYLALLGGSLMLVGLAIDPFIQQVIEIAPSSIIQPTLATIPRAHTFGNLYIGEDVESQNVLVGSYIANMTAAIYAGVFNPDAASLQVMPTCPSGNCTFHDPYRSLAVCSRCVNITDKIVGPVKHDYNTTVCGFAGPDTMFHWSIPNQPFRNETRLYIEDCFWTNYSGYSWEKNYDAFGDSDLTDLIISANGHGTTSFWNMSQQVLFGTISIISTDNQRGGEMTPEGLLPNVWAAECSLEYCVPTYTANVTHGVLTESVIDTFYFANTSDTTMWTNAPPSEGLWVNGTGGSSPFIGLMPHQCIMGDSITAIPAGAQPDFPSIGGEVVRRDLAGRANYVVPPDCFFDFATYYSQGILEYALSEATLSNALIGNYTQAEGYAHFEKVMGYIAASVTKNIRSTGNGTAAFGLVSADEVVLNVHWKWLLLPGLLTVAVVLYLLMTMIQSGSEHVWKGSALAVLFHGLDDVPADKEYLEEMETDAKMRVVSLRRDRNDRLSLVTA